MDGEAQTKAFPCATTFQKLAQMFDGILSDGNHDMHQQRRAPGEKPIINHGCTCSSSR